MIKPFLSSACIPRGLAVLLSLAVLLLTTAPATAQDDEAQRVSNLVLPPAAEAAIRRSLAYLASNQNADGSWGEGKYHVSNTALVVMALMVDGQVPSHGQYGKHLEAGITYLLNQAQLRSDGYIVDASSGTFYQHCLAVMALAEAWGHSKNPRIGPAVRKGTQVILRSQGKEGGWRYSPKPTLGDISVTIMAIEALISAKESGVLVPDENIERAREFLYACQQPDGRFSYLPGEDETNSYRMGAGLLGLQLTGDRDSQRVAKGWAYLLDVGVKKNWAFNPRPDFLDQFYCVQACYQGGDQYIQLWYPKLCDMLVSRQAPNGRIGNSDHLPYGSTALATLILAVPNRYLPIFQR